MRVFSRVSPFLFLLGSLGPAAQSPAQTPPPLRQPPTEPSHALNVKLEQMKWERIFPDLGEKSPEITILHMDPKTGATQLMIRVPKNIHVPKHWHTANETHTVLSGTFVIECEGKRDVLKPGAFNYVPSKMAHEAWTTPGEGTLVFITVDAPWDINFVNGPPKPSDLIGGRQE
jgi:mannose-6-phosphate isomerase-like protein (cupin superfamily)